MGKRDTFAWALARNLAYRIIVGLSGQTKTIEEEEKGLITVTGNLPLTAGGVGVRSTARSVFEVSQYWPQTIPQVWCLEPWVRREPPHWHAGKGGLLCVEFGLNWARELTSMVETHTHGSTADFAAEWLLNSTRKVLNMHHFAFRNGITKWPKEWESCSWPHDPKAAKALLDGDRSPDVGREPSSMAAAA